MTELYPLKFIPILKERVWGGDRLSKDYKKNSNSDNPIGESWELSGLQNDLSEVSNGFLAGNNIEELIEVYMGDLVGEEIFEKYGKEFPLLIKIIDARDTLSIQVHPDDDLARERHHAYGKTEMWYVLDADENAFLYNGFKRKTNKKEYLDLLKSNRIKELLNKDNPKKGDAFFIPAGTVHSVGGGLVFAEIQQTSDITYRIYDWDRKGLDGKPREIHTELAIDALDFNTLESYKTISRPEENIPLNVIDCNYFTTNIISFNKNITKDYSLTDCFIIYICTDGSFELKWGENTFNVRKGDTILIPALLDEVSLRPEGKSSVLEVYLRTNSNE
jgi:mannose-6-phosphate isomerase